MTEVVGYYQFDSDENPLSSEEWQCPYFTLVTKDTWDSTQSLDDGIDPDLVPDGFFELTSSCFEFEHATVEEAKEALQAKGWIEKQLF